MTLSASGPTPGPGPILRDFSLLNSNIIEETKALKARKKFSRTIWFKLFLVLSTLLAFTEPILVGFRHQGTALQIQVIVLALSSVVFVSDIAFTARFYDTSEENLSRLQLTLAVVQGEALLDGLSLFFGWCFIFTYPGIAALRCVRVFRLLWYFELFPDYKQADFNPTHAFFSFRKASQLCLRYMTGIFQEIFTQKSKGGIVLISIYMYVAYLFAVVFWIDTGDVESYQQQAQECYYLNTCFITMIRLSFYDGNGFDFLQTLALTGRVGYTILAFIYLIITGMILLNGLIGIFGTAFLGAVDEESEGVEDTSPKRHAIHTINMPGRAQAIGDISSPKHKMIHSRSFFGRSKPAITHSHLNINSPSHPSAFLSEDDKEIVLLIKSMRTELRNLKETVSDLKHQVEQD